MQGASSPARLFVSLTFSPREHLVSVISRLVSEFCALVMEDKDTAWRFHMAAQELAENITKYSTGAEVTLEVEMATVNGENVMRVSSRNETTPDRLLETARRLDAIKSCADPIALYDRLVRESAPVAGVSGLGLARIRAESDLQVDYSIRGTELTITVHSPIPMKGDA